MLKPPMNRARFLFYGELNDFLPPVRRGTPVEQGFNSHPTVKHLIESLGVPHPEVDRILANGLPAGFDYRVQDGDWMDVYPAPEDGSPPVAPMPEPRFVLDNHLGRLAAYLRMLGFDALYRNDYEDDELAETAEREDRILLTRDRRLLMRKAVRYGYCLRSLDPKRQVEEVLRRFRLLNQIHPFRRCLRCNGLLEPVAKAAVLDQLEPLTRRYFDKFHRCASCSRVYWRGSHYQRMRKLVETILK
jgi:uncharacterized protein with PIN domain